MNTPFAATEHPGSPGPLTSVHDDPHLLLSGGLLLVYGVVLGLFALTAGLFSLLTMGLTLSGELQDLGEDVFSLGFLGCYSVCIGNVALAHLAAAFGLFRQHKWGWIAAVIAYALQLSSCCAPFGVYGLWTLMRTRARALYGIP